MEVFRRLYELFIKYDATLVEINPLAETNEGISKSQEASVSFRCLDGLRAEALLGAPCCF